MSSKISTEKFRKNYDRIFRHELPESPCIACRVPNQFKEMGCICADKVDFHLENKIPLETQTCEYCNDTGTLFYPDLGVTESCQACKKLV